MNHSRTIDMHQGGLPRVLIVEHDPEVAQVLASSLASERLMQMQVSDDGGAEVHELAADTRCSLVRSIHGLHRLDLRSFGAALVASSMPDGCGLDVVAYLRGLAPHLPVVVVGSVADAAVATEAIRAGASEFVLLTGHEAVTIPLAVRKAVVHRQLKLDHDRLQQSLTRSMAELGEVNKRLEHSVAQLEDMARTDELTGLTNRRWLNRTLDGRWAESVRHGIGLGFLMIDLDGFKALNDSVGHQRGDELLQIVGGLLQQSCREHDTAARYGGDEFCLLLPHADLDATMTVAKRLVHAFHEAVAAWDVDLGISIGVSHRDLSEPSSPDELLRHADEAMYAAKQRGCDLMIRSLTGSRLTLAA